MSGNLLTRSQIISAEVTGMECWGPWVCPHEQTPMSCERIRYLMTQETHTDHGAKKSH